MPFNSKTSLLTASASLRELLPQIVFTGGAVLPAYVTDKSAPLPRTGRNLTVVADVAHQADWVNFQQNLGNLGFKQKTVTSNQLESWTNMAITLHITPSHLAISMGKSGWYEQGLFHAQFIPLDKQFRIRVLTLPYLMASFLEQIPNNADLRFCTAWNDLVYLFAYHDNPITEVSGAFYDIRNFLQTNLRRLATNNLLEEAIFYALGSDAHSSRVAKVKSRIVEAAGLSPLR